MDEKLLEAFRILDLANRRKKKVQENEDHWNDEDVLEFVKNLAICHHLFTVTDFCYEFERLFGREPKRIEFLLFLRYLKIAGNGDEKGNFEKIVDKKIEKSGDDEKVMIIIENCVNEAVPPSKFIQEFKTWMERRPQKKEIILFLITQTAACGNCFSLNACAEESPGYERAEVDEYFRWIAVNHPEYFPSDYAREFKFLTDQTPSRNDVMGFLRMECERVEKEVAACLTTISLDKSPGSKYDEDEKDETREFMVRLAITHHADVFTNFRSEFYDWAGCVPTRNQILRFRWMVGIVNAEFNKKHLH